MIYRFKIVRRHDTMIVLSNPLMAQRFGEKAIQVVRSVSGFLEVVVKNDGFQNLFGIKIVINVFGNEKLKVPKVID